MTKVKDEVTFFMTATPGRVIVQEDSFQYTGKILIPDAAKRRPTTGRVVSIGYGVGRWEDRPIKDGEEDTEVTEQVFIPLVNLGDKVVYGLYSGTVLNFKGQPAFRVLNQDEILAVVEGEPELEGSGT